MSQTDVNLTEQVSGTLPVAHGGTGQSALTSGNLLLGNGTSAVNQLAPGTSGNVPVSNGSTWVSQALPASGTVTSVSVASANGFAGSVATSTSTPAISISTTITGLLKGNGTAVSAATSGTDYAPATSGTTILKGNGSGGFSSAAAGTDYVAPSGALGTPTSGNLANCTFPTFNQNTTGNAATATYATSAGTATSATTAGSATSATTAGTCSGNAATATTLATARSIQTNLASSSSTNFDGSANITPGVTGTLPVANGGTGVTTLTGLVKASGTSAFVAATAGTDYVAPGGALGTPSSGVLTNCTFPTLNQSTTGNAATATALSGKTTPSGALVGTTDTQALTNKDLTGAGNTFPTFNQNTTGVAAYASYSNFTGLDLVGGTQNGSAASLTLWIGTTAQYTALGSYSSTTVYVCT